MATTTTSYSVLSLDEAGAAAAGGGFGLDSPVDPDTGRRGRVFVRRDLDIGSFGANAFYQGTAGAFVISEHAEVGPAASGHEELYVVVAGSCTFAVDGDEFEAPPGTAVFVRDPATKRSARAQEDGTIVVVVGGRPGEAFEPGPLESMSGFFPLYRERDYEGALAALQSALEQHPGNAFILYNLACIEALLGRPEEALEPLAAALKAWSAYKELAADDEDLARLHDDPRFQALLA
jgi:quercetin dioxygenase-like cupin family protein